MSKRVKLQAHRRWQGQSMVEYLVICVLVTAVFAFPIDEYDSVAQMFFEAVRTAFRKFLVAISIPL